MKGRALVTGAGGFIGSHLVEALLDDGWEVKALHHYNSRANWGWLESLKNEDRPGLEVVLGSITDAKFARQAMTKCDTVFHLAALIGIPYSYLATESYLQTNVYGTLNLLQAAVESKVRRFIHTSTSEVYGTADSTPMAESHALKAQSPYAASKIAADKLVESFYFSFDLPTVIIRPFNTYGPRQSNRAVIPTIISQVIAEADVYLGALDPIRDLTYVKDTVAAFLAASEADSICGETMNLGTGKGISIGELAKMIPDLMDTSVKVFEDPKRVRPSKSEVRKLVSNNSKARKLLGWEPKVSIAEGLRLTIEWLRGCHQVDHSSSYIV